MAATAQRGMLVGVLAFLAACADSLGPSPVNVPPLSGPATRYAFSGPLVHPVRAWTTTSRYVVYDNGAFSLEYPSSPAGGGTLVGVYAREGDRLSFRFSGLPQDTATGTLNGDLLEVRYSEDMQQSDFEDAVYRRSQ